MANRSEHAIKKQQKLLQGHGVSYFWPLGGSTFALALCAALCCCTLCEKGDGAVGMHVRVEPTIEGRASKSRTKEAARTHMKVVQLKQNLEGKSMRQNSLQVAKQQSGRAGQNRAMVNKKWSERVAEKRTVATEERQRVERVRGKKEGNAPIPTVPTVPACS